MVNSPAAVRGRTVFTDVLDAPVTELAMGHNINVGKNLLNARTLLRKVRRIIPTYKNLAYLILFEAVLEDVLHNKTASLSQSDFVPHSVQSLVDILHDLWG